MGSQSPSLPLYLWLHQRLLFGTKQTLGIQRAQRKRGPSRAAGMEESACCWQNAATQHPQVPAPLSERRCLRVAGAPSVSSGLHPCPGNRQAAFSRLLRLSPPSHLFLLLRQPLRVPPPGPVCAQGVGASDEGAPAPPPRSARGERQLSGFICILPLPNNEISREFPEVMQDAHGGSMCQPVMEREGEGQGSTWKTNLRPRNRKETENKFLLAQRKRDLFSPGESYTRPLQGDVKAQAFCEQSKESAKAQAILSFWMLLWPEAELSENDNICWGAEARKPGRAAEYWPGAEVNCSFL